MPLIQRYLSKELFRPTLATTTALIVVALLGLTLGNLSVIVTDRQSLAVFLKIIALNVPGLLGYVLPISMFVSTLLSANRLHTENETIVCFASGMTRWQVTSPFIRLASLAMLLLLAVNLWVAPACNQAVRREIYRIRTDLAASLVRPGEFTQPSPHLTIYAQSADPGGVLHNVFIYQDRANGESSTINAQRGIIAPRQGGVALVLYAGANQQFSANGVLNYLAFDEYVLDLTPYMNQDVTFQYHASDLYMHELLFPDRKDAWVKRNYKKMQAEAHARLATPLYILGFTLIALLAILGGPFSRLGYGRRIAYAAATAVVARVFGVGFQGAAEATVWLNLLQYLPPLALIWYAIRHFYQGRAAVQISPAPVAASARLSPI